MLRDTYVHGNIKVRTHLAAERKSGLSKAKKAQFRDQHGKLFCEQCGVDPIEQYGGYGESCIEVHHALVAVADMDPGHKTKLEVGFGVK